VSTWADLLGEQEQLAYFQQILHFVNQQRDAGKIIYPPQEDVFNAFRYSEFDKVKVVILGQDPYHGQDQAHGLSFSVCRGVKPPPSLANIFKELVDDIPGFTIPLHGCLQSWAEQGVLLLNTVLTVEQGKAHSHAKIGWQQFTDVMIATLSEQRSGLVFLLWGSHAQSKSTMIDHSKHSVLSAPHPSPLSAYRGFLGCKHFSQANKLIQQQGMTPINWQI
jgi:uracil-DNA glycosylase